MMRALAIMAKRPSPGSTKTRLTPALSPEDAADLYECMLLDTIDRICRRDDCQPFIAIDQADAAAYFERVAPGVPQLLQIGDDLGQRLDSVLTACLHRGFGAAFAIGSDSPDLPDDHLTAAFAALDQTAGTGNDPDVVLGPAEDGGYYLIGWTRPLPTLVTDVKMSTPNVLADTLTIAAGLSAQVTLTSPWYDVDEPDDLARLRRTLDPQLTPRTAAFLVT